MLLVSREYDLFAVDLREPSEKLVGPAFDLNELVVL